SRRASSRTGRITERRRKATSAFRATTTARLRSRTSRSRCCHERNSDAAFGDDVPPVRHLGGVVHDDRCVHGEGRDGATHLLAVHGEPARRDRSTVLRRTGGGPVL